MNDRDARALFQVSQESGTKFRIIGQNQSIGSFEQKYHPALAVFLCQVAGKGDCGSEGNTGSQFFAIQISDWSADRAICFTLFVLKTQASGLAIAPGSKPSFSWRIILLLSKI